MTHYNMNCTRQRYSFY